MVELFIFSALAAIGVFASTNVLSKLFLERTGGPIQWLVSYMTLGLPLIIIVRIVLEGTSFRLASRSIFAIIFFSAIFAFIGFVFLILGFEKGNASVGGVILSSRVIFSIPLAFFFIGERYGMITYVAILISIVGAIIVSSHPDLIFSDIFLLRAKGIRYFLATSLFWSISNMLVRRLENDVDVFLYLVWRQLIMVIFGFVIYIFARNKYSIPKITINQSNIHGLIAYIILTITAQGLFIYSLSQNLTITEGIGILEGIMTFIYSLIFAKLISNTILDEPLDNKTIYIRIIGIILSMVGTSIVILSNN